jgi:hypothetical protein
MVVIQCNVPMSIQPTDKDRVFNMVPGMEAVPISIKFPSGKAAEVRCEISVS